jgi:hypothetical protein
MDKKQGGVKGGGLKVEYKPCGYNFLNPRGKKGHFLTQN